MASEYTGGESILLKQQPDRDGQSEHAVYERAALRQAPGPIGAD